MTDQSYRSVVTRLEHDGLLLQQDKSLTSVVGLVTGEVLSTSWWSHPRAQEIFAILQRLEAVALATRLVAGKVTLVHRKLWPALLTVETSTEPWHRDVANATAPKVIQERLLSVAKEVHTESGRHEVVFEPWRTWAKREGVTPMVDVADAREALERAVVTIGGTPRQLPWRRF